MKKLTLTLAGIALLLSVAACGPSKDEMNANATATIEAVHTRVAVTLTAQAAMFTPTPQIQPTQTMAPSPSPAPTQTAGPTSTTSVSLPVQNKADSSAYMSDVTIPDDMVIAPGTAFTKTWQVYNNGSTTWTTEYKLVFVSGEAMSGASTKLSASVAPLANTNVSVSLVAPTTAGTYTGYWKLQNTAGTYFGDMLSVKIIVSSGSGTVTATATTIGGATATPNLTATPTNDASWVKYEIVAGDTCESIASDHGTSWDAIKAYNVARGMTVNNFCSTITEQVGVKLWVPG